MNARARWRWGLTLVPAVLGLAGALLLTSFPALPDPVIYLRANVGTLALLAGAALSLLAAAGLALWSLAGRRGRRRVVDVRVQTAEERRRFLQRLDHELKNPLTAIRAGLANVVNGTATPAQQAALASVEVQVMRLSRLTSDLRKLAELETRPLERASVDVAELLQEAMTLAQEQAAGEARRIALTLPQAPWPVSAVLGDRDLLFLAVYNLLDNALKFTRPGDIIEVRAFEDGSAVVVELADTGPGIPEEDLPLVWEELYRGQGARGIPGSGLGLALVRAIVERHGGTVALRSRAEQGTVVGVRLPVR